MSKKGNKRKSEQLGMNHATASNRLKKMLMFSLIQETGQDNCFQCGEKIESVDDLSVEHKIPWLDSSDPVGIYFDLDNIAFSHLSCNCRARRNTQERKGHGCKSRYNRGCRCQKCRDAQAATQRKYRLTLRGGLAA